MRRLPEITVQQGSWQGPQGITSASRQVHQQSRQGPQPPCVCHTLPGPNPTGPPFVLSSGYTSQEYLMCEDPTLSSQATTEQVISI